MQRTHRSLSRKRDPSGLRSHLIRNPASMVLGTWLALETRWTTEGRSRVQRREVQGARYKVQGTSQVGRVLWGVLSERTAFSISRRRDKSSAGRGARRGRDGSVIWRRSTRRAAGPQAGDLVAAGHSKDTLAIQHKPKTKTIRPSSQLTAPTAELVYAEGGWGSRFSSIKTGKRLKIKQKPF